MPFLQKKVFINKQTNKTNNMKQETKHKWTKEMFEARDLIREMNKMDKEIAQEEATIGTISRYKGDAPATIEGLYTLPLQPHELSDMGYARYVLNKINEITSKVGRNNMILFPKVKRYDNSDKNYIFWIETEPLVFHPIED